MKDWGEYLGQFYKKIPSIKPYHIFSCDRENKTEKGVFVTNREFDLPSAKVMTYNALKQGFHGAKWFSKGE